MSLKQTYPKKKLKGNYDTRPKKKKKNSLHAQNAFDEASNIYGVRTLNFTYIQKSMDILN